MICDHERCDMTKTCHLLLLGQRIRPDSCCEQCKGKCLSAVRCPVSAVRGPVSAVRCPLVCAHLSGEVFDSRRRLARPTVPPRRLPQLTLRLRLMKRVVSHLNT